MGKRILQIIWDFIGLPFRLVLFDQKWLPRFGWTTLEEERINAVIPYINGRLLDIGAGPNILAQKYGNAIGVDVFEWGGGAIIVEDSSKLPFVDHSFNTISFLACLNHIPNRQDVLNEAKRLINQTDGRLIITMINPILGSIGHFLWWYSEDKQRGGMKEGEVGGIWKKDIISLCELSNFELIINKRFVYGMNNLYIFRVKKDIEN